jgi:alkaline phosphatase isozyme conversion protein
VASMTDVDEGGNGVRTRAPGHRPRRVEYACIALACTLGMVLSGCGPGAAVHRPSPANGAFTGPPPSLAATWSRTPGSYAEAVVRQLAEGIGARVAGTASERAARLAIVADLTASGYHPLVRSFTLPDYKTRTPVSSANVVALKRGSSRQEIVVGAHYDSATVGRGALDNATGVGLTLELARRLRRATTPFTVRFVLFGAEEVGLLGSRNYVETMGTTRTRLTLLMVDLDSVAGGDRLYLYGRPASLWPRDQWARRQLLAAAAAVDTRLRRNEGMERLMAADPRTTKASSDSSPFMMAGVNYLGLEAADWDLPGAATALPNTAAEGRIWHTPRDTVAFLESRYPGRLRTQLAGLVRALSRFLTRVRAPASGSSSAPSSTSSTMGAP